MITMPKVRNRRLRFCWQWFSRGPLSVWSWGGGLWTNSLALLSDSGHVFMDLAALIFTLLAIKLASRPATSRRTFGLHRMEVFAAFLNGGTVAVVAVWIIVESVGRLRTIPEVRAGPALIVAFVGLTANVFVAWRLRRFARADVNLRGAFLHVLSDALASVGVVVGIFLVKVTGYTVIDSLVGLFVAGVIVISALRLLKESVHILLEGVPGHLDLEEVVAAIRSVSGVLDVEDSHVWNICSHLSSLSAHVTVRAQDMPQQEAVLQEIHRVLHDRFRIKHSTIQVESSAWKRQDPADSA